MSRSQTRQRGHWVVEAGFKPGPCSDPRHCLPSERVRGRLQRMGAGLQGGERWAGEVGDPLFLEN